MSATEGVVALVCAAAAFVRDHGGSLAEIVETVPVGRRGRGLSCRVSDVV